METRSVPPAPLPEMTRWNVRGEREWRGPPDRIGMRLLAKKLSFPRRHFLGADNSGTGRGESSPVSVPVPERVSAISEPPTQ